MYKLFLFCEDLKVKLFILVNMLYIVLFILMIIWNIFLYIINYLNLFNNNWIMIVSYLMYLLYCFDVIGNN